jgi:pyrroline-5-carboxylate reductase
MSVAISVGFIGAGKMASALAQGFLRAGLLEPAQLTANDVSASASASFVQTTKARLAATNAEVARSATTLWLAVKPDAVPAALAELRPVVTPAHLVISVAAGIPLATLEAALPPGTRVVRVMPNTPALVGAGASAFSLGKAATREDAALTQRLLSSVGLAVEVKEKLLDAVTGLSGCGPAYGFLIIEALSDGGVAAGLPRDLATRLAAQTLLGAARMVLETGQHPGALKDNVASPGGTTIEGLHELEKAGVRGALINAVRAGAEKSKRLAQS